MAKSKYQKSSVPVGKIAVALLVAGVLTAGVCCMGYAARGDDGAWFGNSDFATWHWSDKSPVSDGDGVNTGDGEQAGGNSAGAGGAIVSEGENHGISLMILRVPVEAYSAEGIDAQADTAYKLTATVEPDEADNKAVSWSIVWNNPDSEWASEKTVTDYVTITPTEDGALTATATCLQAFGEQAIITVTSRDNTELTATVTVDYREKITSLNPILTVDSTPYTLSECPTLPSATNAVISLNAVKSIGSIAEEYTPEITVKLTDEAITWLHSSHPQWGAENTGYSSYFTITENSSFSLVHLINDGNTTLLLMPDEKGSGYSNSAYAGQYFFSMLLPDFNSQTFEKLLFTVTFTGTSGVKTSYEYKTKLSSIPVSVTSVNVNTPSIVF